MVNTAPNIVLLGGPNGAGKTTSAPRLLRDTLQVDEFVNADWIAQGLSGFSPERSAFAAGRIMLTRLDELAVSRSNFAFESTLASQTFRPWLGRQIAAGYAFRLVFLWLPSAEMALMRVQDRVRRGGHDVPADIVRRRFRRGLKNFFELYRPIATSWQMYDSSGPDLRLIAAGDQGRSMDVLDSQTWSQAQLAAHDPSEEA